MLTFHFTMKNSAQKSLLFSAYQADNIRLKAENEQLQFRIKALEHKIEVRNKEICQLMVQLQHLPIDLTEDSPKEPTRKEAKRKTASDVIDRILASYLSEDEECKEEVYYDDEPCRKRLRFSNFSQSE